MPLSTIPTLGAGSRVVFIDPANPGVELDLDNCLQFGEVGTEAAGFIQVTPIAQETHVYVADIDDPVEVSMVFNDVDDANYENLLRNFVDTKQVVTFKHYYKNGRIAEREVALSGLKMSNPEFGSQITATVTGRQSNATTFSIAA